MFEVLHDPDVEWLILDSTATRIHPCAAGAKKIWGCCCGTRAIVMIVTTGMQKDIVTQICERKDVFAIGLKGRQHTLTLLA